LTTGHGIALPFPLTVKHWTPEDWAKHVLIHGPLWLAYATIVALQAAIIVGLIYVVATKLL
jgi:hypothetical protein